jgi:hypothetical protein
MLGTVREPRYVELCVKAHLTSVVAATIAIACAAACSGVQTRSDSTRSPTLQNTSVTKAADPAGDAGQSAGPLPVTTSSRSASLTTRCAPVSSTVTEVASREYPSVHTIAEGPSGVSFEVHVEPETVCRGGIIHVVVTIHNGQSAPVDVIPRLVLNGIYPHPDLGLLDPMTIEKSSSATEGADVTIPWQVPSGSYQVQVYGYFNGANLTIVDH